MRGNLVASMMKCTFCDDLKHIDALADSVREQGMRKDYSIALVDRVYRDKHMSGQISHYGYKLKYCPECGRQIKTSKGKVVIP